MDGKGGGGRSCRFCRFWSAKEEIFREGVRFGECQFEHADMFVDIVAAIEPGVARLLTAETFGCVDFCRSDPAKDGQ